MAGKSYDFDLVVIGSGPAGQRAAIQGAKLGKRVAIIEKTSRGRRGLRQSRHHPVQDLARGGAASVRLSRARLLRRLVPGQAEHHHPGSAVPHRPGHPRTRSTSRATSCSATTSSDRRPAPRSSTRTRCARPDRRHGTSRTVTADKIVIATGTRDDAQQPHPVRRPAHLHQRRHPAPGRAAAQPRGGRRRASSAANTPASSPRSACA